MAIPRAAEEHYKSQQILAAATLAAARRIWAGISPVNLDRSWSTGGPRLRALVTAAQKRAAANGAAYVPKVIAQQGITAPAIAAVNVTEVAGTASSGAELALVLRTPIIRTKQAIAGGATAEQALEDARSTLDGIVRTQLADAGRAGTSLAMAARPALHGYTRMLNPPSCDRCAILAGAFYRWNAGFARHPHCDCIHIPTVEDAADDLTTDPDEYFASLAEDDQDRIFTKSGAEALRDGADIGQVVNARRGMTAAGTTTVGTRNGSIRLMPEAIYRQARTRDDAIAGLRRHGFLL